MARGNKYPKKKLKGLSTSGKSSFMYIFRGKKLSVNEISPNTTDIKNLYLDTDRYAFLVMVHSMMLEGIFYHYLDYMRLIGSINLIPLRYNNYKM